MAILPSLIMCFLVEMDLESKIWLDQKYVGPAPRMVYFIFNLIYAQNLDFSFLVQDPSKACGEIV